MKEYSGNITGMGIRYGLHGLNGTRLFDFLVHKGKTQTRIYSLLDYRFFTLLAFSTTKEEIVLPDFVRTVVILAEPNDGYWTECREYFQQAVLVRPDCYIQSIVPTGNMQALLDEVDRLSS